jgi:XTP/dITP diphosphohydrolase
MKIVIATTNAGKLREIHQILTGLPVELAPLTSYPAIPEPDETGTTFAENARLKALYYAQATGSPAAADDSGLEIDALGGAPGVASARYNGATYPEKFRAIYDALRARGATGSPARFVCAVALARGQAVVFEAAGVVEGLIAPEPRGTGGFGYDPIFFHPPSGRTLAELPQAEKSAVSHRGQAFRALRSYLASLLLIPQS